MKAKDWIPLFQEDVRQALFDFCEETRKLIEQRGKSASAIESSIREQEQKMKAICNKVKDVFVYDFLEVFEDCYPDWYKSYCDTSVRLFSKRMRRNVSIETKRQMDEAKKETDPQVRLGLIIAATLESLDRRREIDEITNV